MNLYYPNLDQTKSYTVLKQRAQSPVSLSNVLSADRISNYLIQNGTLQFSYAASLVDDALLQQLQSLSEEAQVINRYQQIRNGEIMNPGENRKVLHHQPRSSSDRGFYGHEQACFSKFAEQVRKKFNTIVQIGIGGSDLGPRALYLALERIAPQYTDKVLQAKFISNVDPDDANHVLESIDFKTTLFIVVSKSGTTQETLTNLALVQKKAQSKGISEQDIKNHFIAVTGKGSPMDDPDHYMASFYIDDDIGGRYSSTSAVGGVLLSLAFGPAVFEELLQGASELDEAALNPDCTQNMSLLSALIGVWERNFLGYSSKAIIPYSEALHRFPAHLQQLDCESNGKRVNLQGEPLSYETGMLIWGEAGTNGQHSFFQKLHQGSDVIPVQFIGFQEPQIASDISVFGSTSYQKLQANLIAQMVALACGKTDSNPNKAFPGNRPSSLVFAQKLTPKALGALLAFYENTVMFQGFLWNVNSFDQEGVQLGKVLTREILEQTSTKNEKLSGFLNLLQGQCR